MVSVGRLIRYRRQQFVAQVPDPRKLAHVFVLFDQQAIVVRDPVSGIVEQLLIPVQGLYQAMVPCQLENFAKIQKPFPSSVDVSSPGLFPTCFTSSKRPGSMTYSTSSSVSPSLT